jgi:hypothetical protein
LFGARRGRFDRRGFGVDASERIENRSVWPLRELTALRRRDADPRGRERRLEFCKQPRLADAGLARHEYQAPAAQTRLATPLLEMSQFAAPADQNATDDGLS